MQKKTLIAPLLNPNIIGIKGNVIPEDVPTMGRSMELGTQAETTKESCLLASPAY